MIKNDEVKHNVNIFIILVSIVAIVTIAIIGVRATINQPNVTKIRDKQVVFSDKVVYAEFMGKYKEVIDTIETIEDSDLESIEGDLDVLKKNEHNNIMLLLMGEDVASKYYDKIDKEYEDVSYFVDLFNIDYKEFKDYEYMRRERGEITEACSTPEETMVAYLIDAEVDIDYTYDTDNQNVVQIIKIKQTDYNEPDKILITDYDNQKGVNIRYVSKQ